MAKHSEVVHLWVNELKLLDVILESWIRFKPQLSLKEIPKLQIMHTETKKTLCSKVSIDRIIHPWPRMPKYNTLKVMFLFNKEKIVIS